MTDLLDPRFLARLEAVQLSTRQRLAGHLSGEHRSPRRGNSTDFADYRPYYPGDDYRRIDYTVLARLDVLLIRLFEADDDLTLRILVDTSASMAVGGKMRQAARVAAVLGFVSLTHRDPVTVHTFPLDRPGPRFSGRAAVPALFDHLVSLEPAGDTPFLPAVRHLLAQRGPRGLTVVISDLLTADWEAGLKQLPGRGGDLVVIHVLAPDDLSPAVGGDVELVDRESGRRIDMTLSPAAVANYRRLATAWADGIGSLCRRAGAGYARLMADEPIEPLVLGAWRKAGVLR